jgi:hypothetical protein
MKNTALIISLLASTLLTSTYCLAAQSPNWSYVQAGYASVENDDVSAAEQTGYDIHLSSLLSDSSYFIGKYQKLSADIVLVNENTRTVDIEQFSAGLGYRQAMSNTADFYSAVTYEKIESEASEFSDSVDGYSMTSGIRSMFSKSLELSAEYSYLTIDNETDNIITINALYAFSDKLSIGLSYAMADESDTTKGYLRYAF